MAVFVYIKESFVFENKCYTPNVLAETNITYMFPVKVAFVLLKCHQKLELELKCLLKKQYP